ncbi:hypothetical protein [Nocardia wallacei]|uniref:hypothetical protein n=1 Tax=Nocardia wallacei TaxID=480035 RepID=UPI0024554AC9|nr:hypothetical protein [Nocardia wallacei]
MLIATLVVALTALLRRRFGKGSTRNRRIALPIRRGMSASRVVSDSVRRTLAARLRSGRAVLAPGVIAGMAAVTLLSAAALMVPCWCGTTGA